MRMLGVAFACLICVGKARTVQKVSESDARDWELENLARYQAGELNDAQLGMANVVRAISDPKAMSELMRMMNDPEVQELMADPTFQEQAEQVRNAYAPKGNGGAREWELANVIRYLSGEINEAELGLANMQQSFSDPAVLAELMQRLSDPEFVALLEEKLADPTFQEQAIQVLAELKEKKSSKSLASLLLQMGPSGARLADARTSSVNMETNADLRALAKQLNPAIGYFDPLNLGSDDGPTSEQFIGFLRHAEIKHGRVAMAAFIGYCVTANGLRWGFEPFASTASIPGPIDQFEALPVSTRWNLVLGVGFLEGWGELRGAPGVTEPHYMRGGKPGFYPSFKEFAKEGTIFGWWPKLDLWDPFKFTANLSPEQKEKKLLAEINNGRLAMLGLSGFIAEAKVPGSVPLLNGLVPKFEGLLVYPPGLQWDKGAARFFEPLSFLPGGVP